MRSSNARSTPSTAASTDGGSAASSNAFSADSSCGRSDSSATSPRDRKRAALASTSVAVARGWMSGIGMPKAS